MIPALLHQRLFVDSTGGIIPPTFETLFSDNGYSIAPTAAQSGIQFTLKGDGTWYMEKRFEVSGSPQSGNWAASPASGIGAGYSAKFVVTQTDNFGTPAEFNINPTDDGEFHTIGSGDGLMLQLWMNRFGTGYASLDYSVVVSIRNDTTMVVVSGTFTVTLSGDVSTDD